MKTQITIDNYFDIFNSIDISKMPEYELFNKSHNFILEHTSGGSWEEFIKSVGLQRFLETYFRKLEDRIDKDKITVSPAEKTVSPAEKEIKPEKKSHLKYSSIPERVKMFMPGMQQKIVAGSLLEHQDAIENIINLIDKLPKTHETDNIETKNKIIYLHYFYAQSDWYIVEKDSEEEQLQAYGYVILNGDEQNAEWGYINIEELKQSGKVELDFWWNPKVFSEIKEEKEEKVPSEEKEFDFEATYKKLPIEVKAIIDTIKEDSAYEDLQHVNEELKQYGYAIEYDLNAQVTNIFKVKKPRKPRKKSVIPIVVVKTPKVDESDQLIKKNLKMIIDMNGKTVSKEHLLPFILDIQKASEEKKFNTRSKYYKEIMLLEMSLVDLYNSTRMRNVKLDLDDNVCKHWCKIVESISSDCNCIIGEENKDVDNNMINFYKEKDELKSQAQKDAEDIEEYNQIYNKGLEELKKKYNLSGLSGDSDPEITVRTKEEILFPEDTDKTKPSIFNHTIYRMPSEDELKEFEKFPDLTAKEIEDGFGYTMIGRGIPDKENSKMIQDSIKMLIERYPEDKRYKEALEIAILNKTNEKPIIARNKMISAKELQNQKWLFYNLQDPWKKIFGEVTKPFYVLMYGAPKSYKSTMAILFADYFSKHFGTVLYVAAEEYNSPTMQSRMKRLNIDSDRLYIAKTVDEITEDMIPDLVIIDTINMAKIRAEKTRELKEKYPQTSFIFMAQVTKEGDFRGEQDIAHEVDLVIVVKNGEAFGNGRFIQGGYLNIKNLS